MQKVARLGHISMTADDPRKLAEFYRDFLGMDLVSGSTPDHPLGATAFLTSRPDEVYHEIAIFGKTLPQDPSHLAFQVDSLGELRTFYKSVKDKGLRMTPSLNHGVSMAMYFYDPEGNLIEVYWDSGRACPQPYGEPVDLELPEEELMAILERTPNLSVMAGARG